IDYLHRPPHAKAALDTKAALIAQRPGALHAVLDAHERRRAQGSKGRVVVWLVADLGDPAGRRMLAELPLDVANVLFRKAGEAPGDDLLEVLDYRRCPAREGDPWAAIKDRSREKNWDGIGYDLGPPGIDPMRGEAPYRITPGDHATRLHLAAFLHRQGAYDE